MIQNVKFIAYLITMDTGILMAILCCCDASQRQDISLLDYNIDIDIIN